MPKFSVIIPTRDRTDYLAQAVASVVKQDEDDLELIIVNDGAQDVPHFADSRIRVLHSGLKGAVPARNMGVNAASGKYIAWLDDDDRWIMEDHLSWAASTMNLQPALVFADGIMDIPDAAVPRQFSRDADAATLAHDNTILISAVCYPRSWHHALGEFDEALPYYWDWDWYLRVARSGRKLLRRAEAVVDIRIHASNMSGATNTRERRKNLDLLTRKHGLGKIELKNHTDFAL